jgi:DNA invertase Pin-like site-specific DNA recombinase
VTDLLEIVGSLNRKKVRLVSLKENLDTSTATGRMMLTVIGAIAEFERANLLERQKEGIAIARREGKYRGRKPMELENFDEVYKSWKNGEITAVSASKLLGVTRSTFYKKVRAEEKYGGSPN